MSLPGSTFDFLELIYEAAGDPGLWPVFLQKFSDEVGGAGAVLLFYDVHADWGNVSSAVGIDQSYVEQYNRYYSHIDYWAMKAKPLMKSGNVFTSEVVATRGDLIRTEYYNDFLRPQGHTSLLCGAVLAGPASTCFVATYRKGDDSCFSGGARLLKGIMPHLQRGLELHRQISALESRKEATAHALECQTTGVILLDNSGRVVFMNHAAAQMIRANDALCVVHGKVRAALAHEDEVLQRTLLGAIAKQGTSNSHVIALTRPHPHRRWFLSVTPVVCGTQLFECPSAAAALFITLDPIPPAPQTFCKLYDLTPAESRLAARLLSGDSLSAAAEQLKVTSNTVRSQLKSIFLKTNTRRQSQLLRLLLHSANR